jgi:hypothetical protein
MPTHALHAPTMSRRAAAAAAPASLVSEVKRAAEADTAYAARIDAERAGLERRIADTDAKLRRDRDRLLRLQREAATAAAAVAERERAEARAAAERARDAGDRVVDHAQDEARRAADDARRAADVADASQRARDAAARGEVARIGDDARRETERARIEYASYDNGTGRYQALYDHLWEKLVPMHVRPDTYAGAVVLAHGKLLNRLMNDGESPARYYAANPSYFRELGVTAADVVLDAAPDDAEADARINAWVEAVLVRLLEDGLPASALPLPPSTPLPPFFFGHKGTHGRAWH